MELSKKSLRTIESLEKKVSGKGKTTPTLKLISELLTELNVPHEFKHITRTKSKRHPYNGNLIKEGTREYKGFYLRIGNLAIDTVHTDYQTNSYRYARELKELIDSKINDYEKTL